MRVEQTAKQSRDELVARKQQIIGVLDKTIEIFENDGNVDRAEVFKKLKEDFINEEYSIIVVGEFSAGKSTMLNALMGKKILTSFSSETTATVNFLRHKNAAKNGEEGRVFYVDGSEEVIKTADSETIKKYVSKKGDNVATKIKKVDLYLDSDFLKDRVSIVDSPGLNGLAEGHRKITEDQILKSHACIFLFTTDRAGGAKSEFEFLSNVQSKVNTIFFVLNKIDQVKPEEGETVEMVVDILKKNYKEVFPESDIVPEVWPISAADALKARDPQGTKASLTLEERQRLEKESRMEAFENRLMQFLVRGEKTKEIFLAPLNRVQAVAHDAEREYVQEMDLLETKKDSSEVEMQIDELKVAMEEGERNIRNKKQEITRTVQELNRNVVDSLRSELEGLKAKKIKEIKGFVDSEDLDGIIDYFQNFERSYSYRFNKVAENTIKKLREDLEYEIQSGTDEYLSEIDIEFENSDIKFNMESHGQLEINEDLFTIGLEKMDEKSDAIEKEIEELENAISEKNKEVFEVRKYSRRLRELQREKKDLEINRESIESRSLPEIEYFNEEEQIKVSRGGLFGVIGNVLFGDKDQTRIVNKKDDSRYKEAKEKQREDIEKNEARGKELERQMKAITDKSDPDMLELYEKQKGEQEDKLAQKKAELVKESESKIRKIEEKTKKVIRKIQRRLEDVCEDMTQEAEQQIKTELKKMELGFVEVISANVENRIKSGLKREEERLERLKEQLNASEKDKNQRLDELREKDKKIKELLNTAIDLCAEIESIPVDNIL